MITKIVFFTNWPLNKRDYERCGAELLQKNGFEVVFFDFSRILYPLLGKATVPDAIVSDRYPQFKDKKAALSAVSSLGENCFAIVLFPYGRDTFWIYKALSATKVEYAINVMCAIPNYLTDASTRVGRFLKKLSRVTPAKVLRRIANSPFSVALSGYLGIRAPKYWLAAGEKSPGNYYAVYPFGEKTEIMWLHTMDYNNFLEKGPWPVISSDTAVFLDLGAPKFAGDDVTMGRVKPVLSEDKYYPSLCGFLDRVERDLNVKIEIAAHPRSRHDANPEYFGGRKTVRDKTCEMISKAKFVITHASTAVNYVVLLRKPVVFITTNEYEAAEEKLFIASVAAQFGKIPVNIDTENLQLDWNRELSLDTALYEKYRSDFIKKSGTEDINSWQVFANRIKNLSQ